jgi:hypothetical protein
VSLRNHNRESKCFEIQIDTNITWSHLTLSQGLGSFFVVQYSLFVVLRGVVRQVV